jgi:hypothetical protein
MGARCVIMCRLVAATGLLAHRTVGMANSSRAALDTLHLLPGDVAEWLRSGLQSRLHRFDSGRRLSDGLVVPISFGLLSVSSGPVINYFSVR